MKVLTKFKYGSVVKMVVKRDTIIEIVPGTVINTRLRLTPSGKYMILYDIRVSHEYKGDETRSTLIEAQQGKRFLGVKEETLLSYHSICEGILTTKNKPRDHVDDWVRATPSKQMKGFPLESLYRLEVKTAFTLGDFVTTSDYSWKQCKIIAVDVQFLNSWKPIVTYGLRNTTNYECFGVREDFLLKHNQPVPIQDFNPALLDGAAFINIGKRQSKAIPVPKGQLQFTF